MSNPGCPARAAAGLGALMVTDARGAVSGEVYRVRGIVEAYDTTKKPLVFEQRVVLGGR